jgi:hypothetical protein
MSRQVFASPFDKAEFVTDGSKETQHMEEGQYDEGNNGR